MSCSLLSSVGSQFLLITIDSESVMRKAIAHMFGLFALIACLGFAATGVIHLASYLGVSLLPMTYVVVVHAGACIVVAPAMIGMMLTMWLFRRQRRTFKSHHYCPFYVWVFGAVNLFYVGLIMYCALRNFPEGGKAFDIDALRLICGVWQFMYYWACAILLSLWRALSSL